MQRKSPIVLLTRPQAASEAFAASLGKVETVISPIIRIEPRDIAVDPDAYELLIFTSQNAVRAVAGMNLSGRRAACVGEATARAARALGMEAVAADGNASSLIECVARMKPARPVLFLRGVHSRGDIAAGLAQYGIEVHSAVCYDQPAQALNRRAVAVLSGENAVAIPLFSPRSSALLGRAVAKANPRAELVLVAISQAALDAWSGPVAAGRFVSARTTGAAMRDEVLRRIAQWS